MRTRKRLVGVLAALFILTFSLPGAGSAQRLFSLGVGGGVGVGDARTSADGSHAHGLAFLEVKAPLFPLGLRGDGFVIGKAGEAGTLGYAVSAVASLPIPFVTPYGLAGWGRYGLPGDGARTGWHVGAGLRVALGGPALFAELKRHERFSRNLLTVGMRF